MTQAEDDNKMLQARQSSPSKSMAPLSTFPSIPTTPPRRINRKRRIHDVVSDAELALIARCQGVMAGTLPPDPTLAKTLDRLFAAHQDRVYAVCLRIVGDQEKARELAQDTLLTAYEKLPTFRGDCKFSVWLYGIARFLCFNAVRRRGELLVEDEVLNKTDPRTGALTQLRQQERELLLIRAMSVLTSEEQEAVHLRYVEHMPQDRISQVLDLDSSSGARGLLQRCRRKLRRELYRRLEEMGHGSSFIREAP